MGKSRSVNEDYFALRPESGLFLVADGMGGHGNGEVASKLAALSVCETIAAMPNGGWRQKGDERAPVEALRQALLEANQAVFRAVETNADLAGMGATVVALIVAGEKAIIGHAGDSRAYRLRAGNLEQLTEDHTWVGQQVTAGELTLAEARNHPFRNVVTRALGGESNLEVDIAVHEIRSGDLFLLCTDGLTGVVADDRIVEILDTSESLDSRCAALVDEANAGGGPDNITVVVVSCADLE